MSCHIMSCHIMSCHIMSCHVMPCHAMPHVMSHVMSCLMSCHVSCHVMLYGPKHFGAPADITVTSNAVALYHSISDPRLPSGKPVVRPAAGLLRAPSQRRSMDHGVSGVIMIPFVRNII